MNPYQGTEEVNENEKAHGEKTEPAKLGKENQFAQVVNSRVNPTTSLGEQDARRLRGHRMCDSVRCELGLERGEIFEEQSC